MALRKSRVTASAVALLIAAAVPTLVLQHEAQASPSKPPPPVATPSASGSTPSAATLDLSVFASQIETLGVEQYPDSFAGAKLTAAGNTIVYISDPSDSAMISAINALNKSNYPVEFVDVSRSYNQLDALNMTIADSTGQLENEGINLTEQFPDPASGTIILNYQTPNAASFSKLAAANGNSVTTATYAANMSSALKAKFGSDVTLGQETAGPLKATGLTNDTAPFYAGDWLDGPREVCTGGFNVLNASGHPFMLTAGHCGSGTYSNDSGVVGTTSTNWFTGATSSKAPYPLQWDVQALATAGGEGYVWTDYGNVAPIVGALLPAVGVTLTANGSITGEQAGEVDEVDFIADGIEYSPGQYFDAVHQVWIENDTPTPICTQGDSGGPVYQWDGSSHVYASGIISSEGIFTDGGVPVAYACAATLMTSILSGKNATLVTAP